MFLMKNLNVTTRGECRLLLNTMLDDDWLMLLYVFLVFVRFAFHDHAIYTFGVVLVSRFHFFIILIIGIDLVDENKSTFVMMLQAHNPIKLVLGDTK
jgi:hypothetical protein